MQDNSVKLWKYATQILIVMVIALTASCQVTKYSIMSMVEAGATPMQAKCAIAISDSSSDSVLCYASIAY